MDGNLHMNSHRENMTEEQMGELGDIAMEKEEFNGIKDRLIRHGRAHIVSLCGSTRFIEHFMAEHWRLSLLGYIVLSLSVVKSSQSDEQNGHGGEMICQEAADMLDELHFRKIDLADEVRIINLDGYIGHSTSNEIKYAKERGKTITYMEVI